MRNSEICTLEQQVSKLPTRVLNQVKVCPVKGQGVHSWLFKTAFLLQQHHFPEEEIFDLLEENLSCKRDEREIREAVVNAGRYFRGEMPSASQKPWPAVDYATVHKIVVDCPFRLKDLRELSPVRISDKEAMTEKILDALYPGNPLLCFGKSANVFRTRRRELWRGRESGFQFIVPNPMAKEKGLKHDGKESERCLDNTGPRRFLVIEFDISQADEKWGPYVREWKAKEISVLDANAALLLELARRGFPRLPLALAVHSGGKSIHAWYFCEALTDEQLRPFMVRAVRFGADHATWTRCQFVRMPDGTRDNGKRQQVHFFAPEVIRMQGGA
jgi:hypothetical protein